MLLLLLLFHPSVGHAFANPTGDNFVQRNPRLMTKDIGISR
jgi:hypothetical protein